MDDITVTVTEEPEYLRTFVVARQGDRVAHRYVYPAEGPDGVERAKKWCVDWLARPARVKCSTPRR